jgi:Xaa-Pro aminopeptidase
MVLVFEPVIWDDGHAGHRSEEIVAVTDDGYAWLSSRAELDEAGGA